MFNMKMNCNVEELMIITKRISSFKFIIFIITTMFDKCNLYSIRLSKAS